MLLKQIVGKMERPQTETIESDVRVEISSREPRLRMTFMGSNVVEWRFVFGKGFNRMPTSKLIQLLIN